LPEIPVFGIKEHFMTTTTHMPHEGKGPGAHIFNRDGYERAEIHQVSTADVESATVYGREYEVIGSIRSLKVDKNGEISDAVIDVGGFLGLGARSVLMPFSAMTILRKVDASHLRVNLDTTKDKLTAMPHHAG